MVSLTHIKVSTIPDGSDPTIIQPSDWNSQHLLTCSSGVVLGRSTAGTGAAEEISIGSNLSLSGGVLSATGGSGTVTTVSVVSANGLSGTVSNPTTSPAITLATTISGILKGNGTAISSATAGTDYQAPIGTIAGLAKGNGANALTSAIAGTDYVSPTVLGANNGVATLDSTGKLTSTQIPDISIVTYLGAVASQAAMLALTGQSGDWCTRTDLGTNWIITGNPSVIGGWTQLSYPTAPVTSVNTKTGAVTLSASDVGAQASITVSGIVKGNGSGTLSAAVSGTDYAPATSGSAILKGNGAGGFSAASAGTDYQAAITATGLLKGAGAGSVSAAVSGTDYAPATSGSAILKGNGAGGFASATAGTDYQSPIGTISGLVKGNGANTLTAATAGTDYLAPPSGTSLLKANSGGALANAVSGTDYAPATSGSAILKANGSGGFSSAVAGTDYATPSGTTTFTNKTLVASGSNTVEATSGPTSTQLAGMRNKIINGAMMIDQRNAGASVTPTSGQFLVDRWRVTVTQSSKFTAQQSSVAPSGFINSLLVTSSSSYSVVAADIFAIAQPIEGLNVADLGFGTANAATVTLSFWVRSSLTGTFGGSLLNSTGVRTYPFSYTINSANTWEQKTITVAGDTTGTWLTTNGVGLYVVFGLGVGSTYSGPANAWAGSQYWSPTGATSVVGTNGATFYITGVQLEKGATSTPFENRLYGAELALCQRYYFRMLGNGSANSQYLVGVMGTTSAAYYCTSILPAIMRASPTSNYSGVRIWSSGTASAVTSITNTNSNTTNASLWFASSGTFVANSIALIIGSANATDYLDFSAEL